MSGRPVAAGCRHSPCAAGVPGRPPKARGPAGGHSRPSTAPTAHRTVPRHAGSARERGRPPIPPPLPRLPVDLARSGEASPGHHLQAPPTGNRQLFGLHTRENRSFISALGPPRHGHRQVHPKAATGEPLRVTRRLSNPRYCIRSLGYTGGTDPGTRRTATLDTYPFIVQVLQGSVLPIEARQPARHLPVRAMTVLQRGRFLMVEDGLGAVDRPDPVETAASGARPVRSPLVRVRGDRARQPANSNPQPDRCHA